jgi:hypothetical protein
MAGAGSNVDIIHLQESLLKISIIRSIEFERTKLTEVKVGGRKHNVTKAITLTARASKIDRAVIVSMV